MRIRKIRAVHAASAIKPICELLTHSKRGIGFSQSSNRLGYAVHGKFNRIIEFKLTHSDHILKRMHETHHCALEIRLDIWSIKRKSVLDEGFCLL